MNHSPNVQCPDRQRERENCGEVGEGQKETDREAWHTFHNGGKVQQLMMSSVLQSLFCLAGKYSREKREANNP